MQTKNTEDKLLKLLQTKASKMQGVTFLIDQYQEQLYWHIRKLVVNHDDARDVLQEVFLRVWRNIDSFKGESRLFTWLYRIASNEAIRFLERKQRQLDHQMNIQEMLIHELETSPYISGEEIELKLQKAILKLTDKQRLVFNMRYFDDMSYESISEIMESTVNSVKVMYHYAKTQLKEQLKNE